MIYSIFFSIEAIGRDVSSDMPESCSDIDTYLDLFRALNSEGDFFGLIDSNKVCLQVMYKRDTEQYLIEVPRPDLRGSYGSYFTIEESAKILKSLPETFPLEGFLGFKFMSW